METTNMGRFLQSEMRISDEVQLMTLEDHDGGADGNNTSRLRSEGHRRRNSTWSFRVRPRRVRFTTSILGYFKRFWQLRASRAPRRPARNLLGLLAKLQFWRNQRARRIHSIVDSSALEEHSPLLLCNPESIHSR